MKSQVEEIIAEIFYAKKYPELYARMVQFSENKAYTDCGKDVMIGGCGFAWIHVYSHDKNDEFLNWMVENGKAKLEKKVWGKKPGKWRISVGAFNQSILHKESYADAFAKFMTSIDYKAYSGSRLD